MTDEFAINILEQYRENPALVDEIETVEEAVWLDEALAMGIQALRKKDWTPVSEGLPEGGINPITQDFYQYPVTFRNGDVYDVRYYKFGNGHWWHGAQIMDGFVTAWKDLPEPYKN